MDSFDLADFAQEELIVSRGGLLGIVIDHLGVSSAVVSRFCFVVDVEPFREAFVETASLLYILK